MRRAILLLLLAACGMDGEAQDPGVYSDPSLGTWQDEVTAIACVGAEAPRGFDDVAICADVHGDQTAPWLYADGLTTKDGRRHWCVRACP